MDQVAIAPPPPAAAKVTDPKAQEPAPSAVAPPAASASASPAECPKPAPKPAEQKSLFDDLETRREVIDLLGRAEQAEGVRVFIGSENKLFSLSGSSTIVAPYHNAAGQIVGVLGVIGPTRMAYDHVIPIVDITARLLSSALSMGERLEKEQP